MENVGWIVAATLCLGLAVGCAQNEEQADTGSEEDSNNETETESESDTNTEGLVVDTGTAEDTDTVVPEDTENEFADSNQAACEAAKSAVEALPCDGSALFLQCDRLALVRCDLAAFLQCYAGCYFCPADTDSAEDYDGGNPDPIVLLDSEKLDAECQPSLIGDDCFAGL